VSIATPLKPKQVALVDTTLQVDRQKGRERRNHVDNLLAEFDWTVTTSICLLEFKATLLQECITIHNKLRAVGRYSAVRDRLTESSHRQAKLRNHIFQNQINVFAPSSFDVTDEEDRILADKARLDLERVIPRLYKWFSDSVGAVVREGIGCTRAQEPPTKGRERVSFDVNLPRCIRGKNKFCRIEGFLRENARDFRDKLRAALDTMPEADRRQLFDACGVLDSVLDNAQTELSHSECRRAGDCLIALEGSAVATHALSTNARDWSVICALLGIDFLKVEYPTG
jgi:hypothetical protein